MKQLLVLAALAIPATHCAAQAATPPATPGLVHITDGGEFVEVERSADFSIVEVRRSPQGSVPASMFALRGACAVARSRAQQFFTSTPVPGAVPAHRLTFPQAPEASLLKGPAKSVFTLDECAALRF